MTAHLRTRFGTALAVVALLMACPAGAQMIPVADLRELEANAHYQGINAGNGLSPPGFFAKFETSIHPVAENLNGSAEAFAFQSSEFFPAAIYGSGSTDGGWGGDPGGTYDALSLMNLRVRTNQCISYDLDATVDPGDVAGSAFLEVRSAHGGAIHIHVDSGHQTFSGRLSPGEYIFEGHSSVSSSVTHLYGGTYAMIWTCNVCPSPLIAVQPTDVAIACGNTAGFVVIAAVSAGTLTYQWRRNLIPLSNGAHVAGATTSHLTINNACDADTGYYDVVLSNGQVIEPSRLAHLTKGVTTGVAPMALSGPFTLTEAAPNPFQRSTSFQYAAERPMQVSAAIYDAGGRMVRPLSERVVSGPGTLTWDGRSASGTPVPTGIYFLRVDVGGQTKVRRFVRVR